MTLQVKVPDNFATEIQWVLSVMMKNFLGLDVVFSPGEPGSITFEADGKAFVSPLTVFPSQSDNLESILLPSKAPTAWDTRETGLQMHLLNPEVPVLHEEPAAEISPTSVSLNWDIFGTSFLLLSRFEEGTISDLDPHGRVPLSKTMEGRFNLVSRPLVDEYLEILWGCFSFLWPQLVRKPRLAEMEISCDLDHVYCPSSFSVPNLLRRIGSDLLLYHDAPQALAHLKNYRAKKSGNHSEDPFLNAVFKMMDINEAAGNTISFNIKPLSSHPGFDGPVDLNDPTVRHLLRTINDRGHNIGFHPGYLSLGNEQLFVQELKFLRKVLKEERIDAQVLGGRQHYLRWTTPGTARLWEKAGLQFDSTLGFAQQAGFRCGTSRKFPMYDLQERRPLKLEQHPLILMEVSVIAKQYMGLGRTPAALKVMEDLKETCGFYGGCFSMLWHNSQMRAAWDFETYEKLCSQASFQPGLHTH